MSRVFCSWKILRIRYFTSQCMSRRLPLTIFLILLPYHLSQQRNRMLSTPCVLLIIMCDPKYGQNMMFRQYFIQDKHIILIGMQFLLKYRGIQEQMFKMFGYFFSRNNLLLAVVYRFKVVIIGILRALAPSSNKEPGRNLYIWFYYVSFFRNSKFQMVWCFTGQRNNS